MNTRSLVPLALIAAVTLAAVALAVRPFAASALAATTQASEAEVARGKYLVTIMGCNDCHPPWHMTDQGPEPDMSRMLSGHPQGFAIDAAAEKPKGPWQTTVAPTMTAWSGPWGVSFTANLTPDAETGLGQWTLKNFVDTIRTGRHMGRGRPVLPPMPIPVYNNFTDDDLEAVYSYLRTIAPISNRVPEPLPPVQSTAAK